MSEEKEVLAYVITHAGYDANDKPIKGGPYEGHGTYGQESRCLRNAMRWSDGARPLDSTLDAVRRVHPHARVVRVVRKARPSPSEASAVEVLRELVAWDEGPLGRRANADDIFARARRILAASGPDPMPVVRAAMAWRHDDRPSAEDDLVDAVDTYRKAGGK